jgi:hypothetical protein
MGFDVKAIQNDKYSAVTLTHHAILLIDAGYLSGYRADTFEGAAAIISGITMNGYAFLDSIREDRVWVLVLKEIAKAVSPVALSYIERIARKIRSEIDKS